MPTRPNTWRGQKSSAMRKGTFLEMVMDVSRPFDEATLERMTSMSRAAGRSLNWNLLVPDSRLPQLFEAQLAAGDYAAQRGGRIIALASVRPISLVLTFESGMVLDSFPGWQQVMALPHRQRRQQLADPTTPQQMHAVMHSPAAGGYAALADWSQWRITETVLPENKSLNGMLIGTLPRRSTRVLSIRCSI